jgi:hypothetical protein
VTVTALHVKNNTLPAGFYLEQNNPNPFKGKTSIKLCLPQDGKITVLVTNSYGKVVDKLISNLNCAGFYELQFFADGLPRGTYFCHVVTENFSDTREMELTK